jgi:hypothetical protein
LLKNPAGVDTYSVAVVALNPMLSRWLAEDLLVELFGFLANLDPERM